MPLTLAAAPITFHLSLNVADLARSVAFYTRAFGVQPAKRHDDYAKFELNDPPVVFSLVPRSAGTGGTLSHVGFRVADEAAVRAARERLEAAGVAAKLQCDTVCGSARGTKCWFEDPDGNFWEIYCTGEEVDPVSVRRGIEGAAARLDPPPGPVVWEHYVSHPPERIPHADGSVDEVRLTGTFNANLEELALRTLVSEVVRVLKAGGKVVAHGLMGDRPLPGAQPKLPGLAALVSRVPPHAEPMALLTAAGLVGLQLTKYSEQPWFVHDGVGLREVKMIAWKPGPDAPAATHRVLYKGPFRQATADGGWVFPRGQRIDVPESVWRQLRVGAAAEQFLFFEPGSGGACSA